MRHSDEIAGSTPFTRCHTFGLTRSELFTLVFLVAVCNALLPAISEGIARDGLGYSMLNTFEVSAIVWAGIYLGLSHSSRIVPSQIHRLDEIVAATILLACLLPLGPFAWVVLTGFAVYTILSAEDMMTQQAHAGWVMLAVSVPMFWSKRLFNFFADFFLSIDARLVSAITQTDRTANLVDMPGGKGVLQIAAACSSMANVSLAILCWVLFTQSNNVRWRPRNLAWCVLACLSVVFINVTRISLIGFFPHYYDLLHGPTGSTVVSWLDVVVIGTICYFGIKRGSVKTI